MKHFATPEFWALYRDLPENIRDLADQKFQLLKSDPRHPSLHFKKIDRFWTCRIGLHYRTIGLNVEEGVAWFWIGTHAAYDKHFS